MGELAAAVSGIAGAANAAGGIASGVSSIANIASMVGAAAKGIGGMVSALTGDDGQSNDRRQKLTPEQGGVANQLAQQFGLSQAGQGFTGQPGLGQGLTGRINNVWRQAQTMVPPPNTNRFNVRGY